jgi:hypothetical protein
MIHRMATLIQPNSTKLVSDAVAVDGFYVKPGLCLGCCHTHEEAPDLVEHVPSSTCGQRCRFKKQPATREQMLRAIKATHVSCSRAVRYGGNDPVVLDLLASYGLHEQCDRLMQPPNDPADPLFLSPASQAPGPRSDREPRPASDSQQR